MEILFNLFLILPLIYWFYKLKETSNPYVYIGLLIISSLGLIITINSGPYITTGYTEDYTYSPNNSQHIDTITTTPIKQDLGAWSYVILLFYLASLLGSVLYWAFSREKQLDY